MTFVQKANDSKIHWQSQGAWGRGMWPPNMSLRLLVQNWWKKWGLVFCTN